MTWDINGQDGAVQTAALPGLKVAVVPPTEHQAESRMRRRCAKRTDSAEQTTWLYAYLNGVYCYVVPAETGYEIVMTENAELYP